ncbi:MAG: Xaa-Pro peptidase family protein [Planctomycetota bacterium]|jgi:Xaa-Pro aminopeptidase|nr:Xaa-Pro peptidase family protein [Planctomycetota bacterium]
MSETRVSIRRGELAQRLERAALDGAVLDNRDDIFYFTGYTGSDAMAILPARGERFWLATDSRYQEEAELTAPGADIRIRTGGLGKAVGKLLRKLRLRRVGFTPNSLQVFQFDAMRLEAPEVSRWLNVGQEISAMRAVKDANEIQAVEKALAIAEAAFLASRKRWRIGMSEIEVKNDLEWEMRRLGADDAAFETIAAAGANASLPHAHSGQGKIRPGKMLLVDFGARLARYHSDLTRTLWAGEIPKVWRRRYQAVQAAQRAGALAIQPGVSCRVPDQAANRVLAAVGLDEYFSHGLGHGVGLAIHEAPTLSRRSRQILAPGNVVTVEPGIYLPGVGGIRLEDMALVTPRGSRLISSLPREIDDLIF